MATFASLFATESVLSSFSFNNEAMAAAVKKAQEAKHNRAAEESATLLGTLDAFNNGLLTNLRTIRKQEKVVKDHMDKFKEAAQYFLDTGNFGPLYLFLPADISRICRNLGVSVPTAEEQKIPAK